MADVENPKVLIGASIPRSGHHFLADMMTGYFGPELYYCEYYTLANCCKQVPCTRRGRFGVIYQKSHDRDFKLPADVADALYLIQYRHPVPEALSDRELDIKDTLGRPSLAYRQTRAGFMQWLAAKAVYYRRFHDKWMAERLPNALYLDYAELSAKPADTLREIVTRAGAVPDEAHLRRVVERSGGSRGGGAETYKPRVVSDSPYFDAELLGALEDFVLKRCPAYGFTRELSGSYEESALYGLILLKDQSEPLPKGGDCKRFKLAAKLAPDHPEVRRRNIVRMLRENHVSQALTRAQALIEDEPLFAPGYELLFKISADSDAPVPESALTGNALIACSESAELLGSLADAFLAAGYAVNAVAASSLAAQLAPKSEKIRERLDAAMASATKK